jgi:hypothetical protein
MLTPPRARPAQIGRLMSKGASVLDAMRKIAKRTA